MIPTRTAVSLLALALGLGGCSTESDTPAAAELLNAAERDGAGQVVRLRRQNGPGNTRTFWFRCEPGCQDARLDVWTEQVGGTVGGSLVVARVRVRKHDVGSAPAILSTSIIAQSTAKYPLGNLGAGRYDVVIQRAGTWPSTLNQHCDKGVSSQPIPAVDKGDKC